MDNYQNKPLTPDPLLLAMNHTLDDISRKLNPVKCRAPHMESIAFTGGINSYQTLTDKGFPYVGIYLAAAQSLTVTLLGVVQTLGLLPGYNRLNVPYGTNLSAAINFQGVLIWSDIPFDDDNPQVQLAGSNGAVGQDSNKNLLVGIRSSAGVEPNITIYPSLDSWASGGSSLQVATINGLFNETTFDRQRGNTQGTLLASAARTASSQSPNQTNYNARGVLVYLNITGIPASPAGLQLSVMGFDTLSGNTTRFAAIPSAITAIGLYAYVVYPGASSGTAGSGYVQQSISSALPRTWLVYIQHGDAQSYTYSVGYQLIV